MIKIYNSGSALETNQILATLKENHIAAYGKEAGAGGYMKIATGMSITGTDIYVDEEKEEAAKQIIETIVGDMPSDNVSAVEENQQGSQTNYQRGGWKRRLVASLLLLFVLAGIVLCMFFA